MCSTIHCPKYSSLQHTCKVCQDVVALASPPSSAALSMVVHYDKFVLLKKLHKPHKPHLNRLSS